ncbi:MAG TPA: PH domain-containing protein [Verrucomicrobiae bacterium]|nr:PH domain-containing protein [Verrucomicrobiae bacterium]
MVSPESVEKQLKKLDFNPKGWGRSEVNELPHILVPDEEIYELANGYYEAGFALLVSTNIRVVLIDRKPMNYLTVEDLRFDMINEIDYSHRLIGAVITITTGSKVLKFTSYNQKRLRKLIGHVQSCMAQIKMKQSEHQEGQVSHLEKINEQLQSYLFAQQQYQQQLHQQLQQVQAGGQSATPIQPPEQVRPGPELADYLYARSLLDWHEQRQTPADAAAPAPKMAVPSEQPPPPAPPAGGDRNNPQLDDLYNEAVREIFGRYHPQDEKKEPLTANASDAASASSSRFSLPLDPLRIAYSKLPMALRNRRFGRPSFHAHSQQPTPAPLPHAPR